MEKEILVTLNAFFAAIADPNIDPLWRFILRAMRVIAVIGGVVGLWSGIFGLGAKIMRQARSFLPVHIRVCFNISGFMLPIMLLVFGLSPSLIQNQELAYKVAFSAFVLLPLNYVLGKVIPLPSTRSKPCLRGDQNSGPEK